jgi:hypothetical protein
VKYFDFSIEVERAREDARDDAERLSARTEVGRKLFPGAVRRAGFELFTADQEVPWVDGRLLVIAAATWSNPDLEALDQLAQNVEGRSLRVLVLDVDDWSLASLRRSFPGVRPPRITPLVIFYQDGELIYSGEGRDAVLWLDQI